MPTKCELQTIRPNRRYRILTDDDLLELQVMYNSGKFYIKEIAEWLGVTPSDIRYWVKKLKSKWAKI